jgi:hypothetical protein
MMRCRSVMLCCLFVFCLVQLSCFLLLLACHLWVTFVSLFGALPGCIAGHCFICFLLSTAPSEMEGQAALNVTDFLTGARGCLLHESSGALINRSRPPLVGCSRPPCLVNYLQHLMRCKGAHPIHEMHFVLCCSVNAGCCRSSTGGS